LKAEVVNLVTQDTQKLLPVAQVGQILNTGWKLVYFH